MKYRKNIMLICGFLYTVFLLQRLEIPFTAEQDVTTTAKIRNAPSENAVTEEKMEKPKIAITFDDGPNKASTPKLLDGLKKRNVKASFFVIGKLAEENEDIVKRQQAEGHLIGNHTYNHVDITRMGDADAKEEIQKTSKAIAGITGEGTDYVRPPFGVWQKNLEKELSMIPVMWTIDPLDWTTENTDEIVNRVVTKAKENDIILLHDCYESSVDAALRIIDILTKEGYEFVTVDEMILD